MKCDENLRVRVRVQKNRNIGAGSGSQKMEISGPGPGPDSEKISGLISGPGTRNKPSYYTDLERTSGNAILVIFRHQKVYIEH